MDEIVTFDYGQLDIDTREALYQDAQAIKVEQDNVKTSIVRIGEILTRCRDRLRYDEKGFNGWLQLEFGWSRRTAYNFIDTYEAFGKCANFAHLDIDKSALYLLAAPSTPEPARQEALNRAEAGERITHKKAQEVKAKFTPPAPVSNGTAPRPAPKPTGNVTRVKFNDDSAGSDDDSGLRFGRCPVTLDCDDSSGRTITRRFTSRQMAEILLACAGLSDRELREMGLLSEAVPEAFYFD